MLSHAEMDGKTYAYAVVARKDQPGLVLCYEDVTGYKEVDNELSLDTLLSGNNFTMEAAIIISDGASIINRPAAPPKTPPPPGTVVVYTSGEMFTYRTTTIAYAVLLYLLLVSFHHMIHYRYARKNTEYIEK